MCVSILFLLQTYSNSEFTSDVSILNSLFVESLDLLVFASEDNNICKSSVLLYIFAWVFQVFQNISTVFLDNCHAMGVQTLVVEFPNIYN